MQSKAYGKGIASMVLGILSIVLCYVPVLGLILSLVGLPLGVSAMRALAPGTPGGGRGMAIAGVVTTIVGLVFGLLIIAGVLLVGCAGLAGFTQYYPYY